MANAVLHGLYGRRNTLVHKSGKTITNTPDQRVLVANDDPGREKLKKTQHDGWARNYGAGMFAYRQPRYKQPFLLSKAHSEKLEYQYIIEIASFPLDLAQIQDV